MMKTTRPQYVMALDQGTSSSRALIFNHQGHVVAQAQQAFAQHFPQPGWVEHDPEDIWQSQLKVAQAALAQLGIAHQDASSTIAAIGLTNQRETTLIWNRHTGLPLHHALVWQDLRTADRCQELREQGYAPLVQRKTGLVLDSYFSASKLEWLLDHVPGARELAHAGDLAFGTVDTWLLWNLSHPKHQPNGKQSLSAPLHATDVSNASRTMLWNIHTGDWDDELLQLFRIPRSILPEVRPSSGDFGQALALGAIPIRGVAGDQQAAAFGQACWETGLVKNTYGTGCFMLCNTGEKAIQSQHQLLSSAAWQLRAPFSHSSTTDTHALQYCLEGSVFMAGATIQWLRDELGIIQHAQDIEPLAASVPDNGGLMLVPAFTGLGAPHWDTSARGALLGLTRGSSKAHIARASLEGIAHQVCDVLNAMQADLSLQSMAITELRVDGGASQNDLLMQIQANLLQLPIVRPNITETTALGAAFLAGLAEGFWKNLSELTQFWQIDRRFEPEMGSLAWQKQERARWANALEKSKNWL
jgi:glycerol kinase